MNQWIIIRLSDVGETVPPKSYVEALTPSASNVSLFGNRIREDLIS